jgi:hypothetical protein
MMGETNSISKLMAFIEQDNVWRERLRDVVADHLMPAFERFAIDHDELAELIGEHWMGVLWGCGFEDFLGVDYEDGNIIDLYLKRRGWNETERNRAYLAGLRDTPVSLYEISEVQPGTSMMLRNLLSKDPPVLVQEKSATRMLKQWDKIAVRVVREDDHHVISGAMLPLRPEAAKLLYAILRDILKIKKRGTPQLSLDQRFGLASIFTTAWLFSEIEQAQTLPHFTNTDGDDLLFHELRFPLLSGVTQKALAEQINLVQGFLSEGSKSWTWLATQMSSGNEKQGATVFGSLELKGKTLHVTVNSAQRATKVEALIRSAAGYLLKSPLTTIKTVEQLRSEQSHQKKSERPPEIARQLIHDHLNRHYRETLDTPIPALGNKSPRQLVRTTSGREKVIDWLKDLEKSYANRADSLMAQYDFSWMWKELGLEDYRK